MWRVCGVLDFGGSTLGAPSTFQDLSQPPRARDSAGTGYLRFSEIQNFGWHIGGPREGSGGLVRGVATQAVWVPSARRGYARRMAVDKGELDVTTAAKLAAQFGRDTYLGAPVDGFRILLAPPGRFHDGWYTYDRLTDIEVLGQDLERRSTMAGRPKTMVRKVTAFEEVAYQLACDLCTARPGQYAARDGHEGDDEVCLRWNQAAHAVQVALIATGELLGALERKAGLGEEPERQRLAERGLAVEEEAELVGT